MYGIISDTHCHNWSTFATVGVDGVNTRLSIILKEIKRAAEEVKKAGGKRLFHAGDLFHVRGSVAPSVLNPTLKTFEKIIEMGIEPVIICGNHDTEFRETNDLGSAVSALAGIGCQIVNRPKFFEDENVLCMPWIADKKQFLDRLKLVASGLAHFDLICHVALNGVFDRIEGAQCVNPDDIRDACGPFKVQRIFAGHLHAHKKIDRSTWSIGAIAQHNWGDVGTQAGFLLVNQNVDDLLGAPVVFKGEVKFVASHAPQFIDIDKSMSLDDLRLEVDGNYVRAVVEMTEVEVKAFRHALEEYGAKGVTIICHTPAVERADRITVSETESLEAVVDKYIKKQVKPELAEKVGFKALEIMNAVEG